MKPYLLPLQAKALLPGMPGAESRNDELNPSLISLADQIRLWRAQMFGGSQPFVPDRARADDDEPTEDNGNRWVMINGAPVMVDQHGMVVIDNKEEYTGTEAPPIADELGELNKQIIAAEAQLKDAKTEGQLAQKAMQGEESSHALVEARKLITEKQDKLDGLIDKLKVANKQSLAMPMANPQNAENAAKEEEDKKAKGEQKQVKDERDHETSTVTQQQQHEKEMEAGKQAHEMKKEGLHADLKEKELSVKVKELQAKQKAKPTAKADEASAPMRRMIESLTDEDGNISVKDTFDESKKKRPKPADDAFWERKSLPIAYLIPTQKEVSAVGVEHYLNVDTFEPIRVLEKDGKFYIYDGHHRSAAATLRGEEMIEAELAKADQAGFQVSAEEGVTPKQASGVLFIGPNGKVLLGLRAEPGDYFNHWGIFGGHRDPGETPELTAIREVLEETQYTISGSLQLIATTTVHSTEFTYFVNVVQKAFDPILNEEHTGFGWFAMGEYPEPLIPGLFEVLNHPDVKALRLKRMNELDAAKAVRNGSLASPHKFANFSLYRMRVTGTGKAFRAGFTNAKTGKVFPDEHVFRKPENYLTPEFLERCQGLALIWQHPKKKIMDSKEFHDRIVGMIVCPWIQGSEVWGIAKVYDDDAIALLDNEVQSTSPSVVFLDSTVNSTIELSDGSTLLIEGDPGLLDHLAVCEVGVWDKGNDPTGVQSDTVAV